VVDHELQGGYLFTMGLEVVWQGGTIERRFESPLTLNICAAAAVPRGTTSVLELIGMIRFPPDELTLRSGELERTVKEI
jgi:hypothetical protein